MRIGKLDILWNRYLLAWPHFTKWEPWARWKGGIHVGPLRILVRSDHECMACLDEGWLWSHSSKVPCDVCDAGKRWAETVGESRE